MAQWRGILYTEKTPESAVEQATKDQSSVTRTLDFLPDPELTFERREFIRRQFLGYTVIQQEPLPDGRVWLKRVTPHFYPAPTLDSGPYLYATSFAHSQWVGQSDSENTASHAPGDRTVVSDRWRVSIVYDTPSYGPNQNYDVKEDDTILADAGPMNGLPDEGLALSNGWTQTRYIARQIQQSGRVLTTKVGTFYYVGVMNGPNPAFAPEPGIIPDPFDEICYVWQCPDEVFPYAAVHRCQGAVNNDTFDGHPIDTLMLLSAPRITRRDRFGEWQTTVSYKMKFVPRVVITSAGPPEVLDYLGHQSAVYYPPNAPPRWHRVSTRRDGVDDFATYPFRRENFNTLFRPRQS